MKKYASTCVTLQLKAMPLIVDCFNFSKFDISTQCLVSKIVCNCTFIIYMSFQSNSFDVSLQTQHRFVIAVNCNVAPPVQNCSPSLPHSITIAPLATVFHLFHTKFTSFILLLINSFS